MVGSVTSLVSSGSFGQFQVLDYVVDNLNEHLYLSWCQHEDAQAGDFALVGVELFYEP